jgi:hypothetical protein
LLDLHAFTSEVAAMHYKELSTPALTIDLDILEANLDRMAAPAKFCAPTAGGRRSNGDSESRLPVRQHA